MNRADRRKVAKTNKERIEEYNQAGHQLMQPGGDARQARRLFQQVLGLDPKNSVANLHLGTLEMWLGNSEKAYQLLSVAREADASNPAILNGLGLALQSSGDIDQTMQHFQDAIQADPDFADAHTNLARVFLQTGKLPQALEEADQAVTLAPDSGNAHLIYGAIAQAMGKTNLARSELQTALVQMPWHMEASFRLCRLSYDPARPDEYLDPIRKNYEKNRSNTQMAITWAEVLLQSRRYSDAIDVLEKHLDAEDLSLKSSVLCNIACAHASAGNYEEAIRFHKEGLANDPDNPGVRYLYGRSLFYAGEYKLAQEQLWRGMQGLPFAQDLIGMLMHTQKVAGHEEEAVSDFGAMVKTFDLSDGAGADHEEMLQALHQMEMQDVHPFDVYRRQAEKVWEGVLENSDNDLLRSVRSKILDKMSDYVSALPDEGAQYHPTVARKQFGTGLITTWAESINKFSDFSYSVDQQGWFRGIYFLDVPKACEDEKKKEGWLRFGIPHVGSFDDLSPDGEIKPVAGQLVVFPAYSWFGFNALSADTDLTYCVIHVNSEVG